MNSVQASWQELFNRMPLIAILRGITPDECIDVVEVLSDEGFTIVEVPLNSPDAITSIKKLRAAFPDMLVGAGTVTSVRQVRDCLNASSQLIVAPNFNEDVALACSNGSIIYCPGVATPSEAFSALDAGADALKLFPSELLSPKVIKAMVAVLPDECVLIPVGGITAENMQSFAQVGAQGFGVGSALYKSGKSVDDIRSSAREFIQAHRLCKPE